MNKYTENSKALTWVMAVVLTGVVAGCGGGGDGGAAASSTGASAGPIGSACVGAACVSLGTAAHYAILAKTGVSTVPSSAVTGHVGLSPAARTFLTGWSLITEPTDTSFTSAQVAAPG